MQAKALQLHKKLCEQRGDAGLEEFTASDGWMWRFSRRHGIRQLMLQGEKLSANKPAAEEFCGTFQEFVEDNHYTLNQIFNCDETGLYYKLMPQKTFGILFRKICGRKKNSKRRRHHKCLCQCFWYDKITTASDRKIKET